MIKGEVIDDNFHKGLADAGNDYDRVTAEDVNKLLAIQKAAEGYENAKEVFRLMDMQGGMFYIFNWSKYYVAKLDAYKDLTAALADYRGNE